MARKGKWSVEQKTEILLANLRGEAGVSELIDIIKRLAIYAFVPLARVTADNQARAKSPQSC